VAEPEIPGYSIVERLGSGGFATVYRALHEETGIEWAIKVLHDHATASDDLRRFERERTTMQALSGHEHIVSVDSYGQTEDGQHYTVLEYVGGGSVRDLLQSSSALHWGEAVSIGVQICAALDLAHRNGVLHRDVKPGNILLDGSTAKLTDFGIARLVGQSAVTAAQSIVGTLAYTPPELFHNNAFDGRGDIYQLGITLYEMLLGRAPFTSAAADNKAMIIRRILENPAPPLAQFDIPQELSDLLDEVLAKDPADRPQTAARFGQRLNEVEIALGQTPTIATTGEPDDDFHASALLDEPTAPEAHPSLDDSPETAAFDPWSAADPNPEFSIALEESAEIDLGTHSPDPDLTIVDDRPANTELIASSPAEAPTPEPEPQVAVATQSPQEKAAATPTPTPSVPQATNSTPTKSGSNGSWKWVLGIFIFALAVGGGLLGAQLASSGDDPSDQDQVVTEEPTEEDDEDVEPETLLAFAPFATDAFSAPGQSVGVAFGSVANSQGLTIVGASGDADSVNSQSSQLWTIGPSNGELVSVHRPNFPESDLVPTQGQRLWDIGVNQEVFLAVGDQVGEGTTDGVAWLGEASGEFVPASDSSFLGSGADSLLAAVADGDDAFLVGGRRTFEGGAVPSIWQVTRDGNTWNSPIWTVLDIGATDAGEISDVAVDGDLAVAVGTEEVNNNDSAIIKIRRGNAWQNLIAPIESAEFTAVTIAGDRIVAVGARDMAGQRTPFAVVATTTGEGFVHNLPLRGSTGIARDVTTTLNGTIVAIGDDLVGDSAGGGIWEHLPGEELGGDRWTTRASTELTAIDGFIELWSIEEFDEQLFVFGRTEIDGDQPAGAWTLDLSQ